MLKKNIIYFSRFYNDPGGNGGDRRTAQICQMLSPLVFTFISMHDNSYALPSCSNVLMSNGTSLLQKVIRSAFKQHVTYYKYNKWSDRYRDNVLYFHSQSRSFIKVIEKLKPSILLVDDPIFLAPVVYYAKSRNIPLVAFCHNLESLSREQVEYKYQKYMFNYELNLLSMCRLVVTISREETFLLKNFGLDPVFYPYYPVSDTVRRFQKVREKRQKAKKSNFLLFGSVGNLPTLDGMKRLLWASTQNNNMGLHNDQLIVTGYGTNMLLNYVTDSRVQIRGQLSDNELDEILAETKGCIIYQENGSGALTKIPELLIAGIPVIINSHAARSHYNLPGVFEFPTFEGLHEQLKAAARDDPMPNALPKPDTVYLHKRMAEIISSI